MHDTITADTNVDVTFTLDGATAGNYAHTPDSSSTILYSVPMLAKSGLENKAHTLVAKFSDLLIFDYAMYTCVKKKSRHVSELINRLIAVLTMEFRLSRTRRLPV